MKYIKIDLRECECGQDDCNCQPTYDVLEVNGEGYKIVGPEDQDLIALANCFSETYEVSTIDSALIALNFDSAYGTIGLDKIGLFD